MQYNTEEHALLKAIWKRPKDLTARLVYADWLQEHGFEWEAGAVRYWCSLNAQDHEAMKLVIFMRRRGKTVAYHPGKERQIPRVSREYAFGMLDRQEIQNFPSAPGKGKGPEWDRYEAAVMRLFYYSVPSGCTRKR